MENAFKEAIAQAPIVAAVKNREGLEACLEDDNIQVVFLLFGDIITLPDYVGRIRKAGKIVIVHIDFISGLQSSKDIAVDYVRQMTGADGIITTHPNCIRRAKEYGMYTVLRAFILDSISLESIPRLSTYEPDFIEVLPGVMPNVIRKICAMTDTPILAGGLLADKSDVIAALDAGASGVSTTSTALWQL